MHFFAAPARAPRRHGSDARASHPIRARRPGDRRPTLRSGIRNSYASTHAHVDVRHRRRFPGRLRREQDDERAPYYALFWTPPPATGFTWAVNGEFPTLRSQQTQISRKCAHFDARRYVRGSVPEFNARVYGAHIGHRSHYGPESRCECVCILFTPFVALYITRPGHRSPFTYSTETCETIRSTNITPKRVSRRGPGASARSTAASVSPA